MEGELLKVLLGSSDVVLGYKVKRAPCMQRIVSVSLPVSILCNNDTLGLILIKFGMFCHCCF